MLKTISYANSLVFVSLFCFFIFSFDIVTNFFAVTDIYLMSTFVVFNKKNTEVDHIFLLLFSKILLWKLQHMYKMCTVRALRFLCKVLASSTSLPETPEHGYFEMSRERCGSRDFILKLYRKWQYHNGSSHSEGLHPSSEIRSVSCCLLKLTSPPNKRHFGVPVSKAVPARSH